MIKIMYAVINQFMPEGFEDDLVFMPGEYEIMLFYNETIIEVNGKMKPYPGCTCIAYRPGQHVHYRAASGRLMYSWIRFECDEPLFMEDDYIPFGVPVRCPDYNYFLDYFRMVANENYWLYKSSEYVIADLMHIIFHRLHDYAYTTENISYHHVLMKLRDEIYQHPEYDWSLEGMAERVSMSPRTLQEKYQEYAHVSCIQDVITSRLSQAKARLLRTNNSIQEISEQCGYRNVEHFCRQFKKMEQITPLQYRKKHHPQKATGEGNDK